MSEIQDPILKKPSALERIPGWGADLDPRNRPGVPRELPSEVRNVRGPEIPRMIPKVKIHMSIEHPDLTPVFGTTCPPRGLSGLMRDFGYKFGEGRLARWMTLMAADRVDVIEGVLEDLVHARVPNTYRERGWDAPGADRERRRRNLHVGLAVAGVGLAVVGLAMLVRRSDGEDFD